MSFCRFRRCSRHGTWKEEIAWQSVSSEPSLVFMLIVSNKQRFLLILHILTPLTCSEGSNHFLVIACAYCIVPAIIMSHPLLLPPRRRSLGALEPFGLHWTLSSPSLLTRKLCFFYLSPYMREMKALYA